MCSQLSFSQRTDESTDHCCSSKSNILDHHLHLKVSIVGLWKYIWALDCWSEKTGQLRMCHLGQQEADMGIF